VVKIMDRFTAHMDRAWDLISKGDNLGAFVAARQAIQTDVDSPEAHNLIGYLQALDGDYTEALASYQRAMELDEWYLDPILNTAELLIHTGGDIEEAIQLCELARGMIVEGEEFVDIVLLEVDALLGAELIEEARVRLDEIEDHEGLSGAQLLLLGRAYYEIGDLEVATRLVESAFEHGETSSDVWYYRGLIARDNGRRIDSVAAFTKVLAKDKEAPLPPGVISPEAAKKIVLRAITLLKGDAGDALKEIEIVVANLPSHSQVCAEVDPRQMLLLEGIDPVRRSFKKMYVFVYNLARSGFFFRSADEELAVFIEREIGTETNTV
jgi:tetratricopeptide (TPR) repeat protein